MILCLSFVQTLQTNAQSIECGTTVPSSWNQKLIEDAELAKGYTGSPENPRVVPVRFVQGLRHFQLNTSAQLSQTEADAAVAYLNTKFIGSGVTFELCGPVQYIIDGNTTVPGYSFDFDRYGQFEYATGTMVVYVTATTTEVHAKIPCPFAYQTGNPSYNISCAGPDNYVYINTKDKLGQVIFPHEVGHHLGLLHTFHPANAYINPPTTGQPDRPYLVLNSPTATQPADPNWFGRELVIREDNQNKTFKIENILKSGDLVGDTPADCADFNGLYPGCPLNAQNTSTCEIDASQLTYKDYNNDAIYPPPAGHEIGNNYMSYWKAPCLNKFTEGQFERVRFMYDNYREPAYGTCGSFAGDVSFWNTGTKIPNVTIRIEQYFSGNQFRKTNTTTNSSGEFSSIIFDGPVSANVYHNGQQSFFKYALGDNRVHFDHKHCEWVQGIDAQDLYLIGQHTNGNIPFENGYQKIAADANKSGTITNFDITMLRRLLKPSILELPAHDQIFRFVPEYVPQNFTAGFNANPFNMGGVFPSTNNLNCTMMTEAANMAASSISPFVFNIPNIQGQQGFDAIKIGDVDGSWMPGPCSSLVGTNPDVNLIKQPDVKLELNQEAVLTFASKNFVEATAFSLGISIPDSHFEIVEVKSQTLTDLDPVESFGLSDDASGHVSVIWAELTQLNTTLSDGSGLFSIKVKAKQLINDVGGLINLDNSVIKNKIWRKSDNKPDEISLMIEPVKESGARSNSDYADFNTDSVLKCMPNPTSGVVQIRFNSQIDIPNANIGIFNTNGQLIYEQNTALNKGINTIDTDAFMTLPTGTYQIQLITGGRVYSTKIIRN